MTAAGARQDTQAMIGRRRRKQAIYREGRRRSGLCSIRIRRKGSGFDSDNCRGVCRRIQHIPDLLRVVQGCRSQIEGRSALIRNPQGRISADGHRLSVGGNANPGDPTNRHRGSNRRRTDSGARVCVVIRIHIALIDVGFIGDGGSRRSRVRFRLAVDFVDDGNDFVGPGLDEVAGRNGSRARRL